MSSPLCTVTSINTVKHRYCYLFKLLMQSIGRVKHIAQMYYKQIDKQIVICLYCASKKDRIYILE